MWFIKRALFAAAIVGGSAALADDGGVPPAHVPDPDLNSVQVLAMWSQIMPDGAQPTRTPNLEIRYIVYSPGQSGQSACTAPGLSFVGLKPGTTPKFRAQMRGRAKNRTVLYDASVCTATPDPTATEVGIMRHGHVAPLYHDPRFYENKTPPTARVPGPAAFGTGAAGELRAVFLADTGCRGQDTTQAKAHPPHHNPADYKDSRFWQDCQVIAPQATATETDRSWPLNDHAWQAVASDPDFVMHGGDYHYYFEDHSYWTSSDGQDRLEYWFQEFLLPAQPLLLAAPFAFGRGNHEVCDFGWFGPGYLALLNAGPETFCGAQNQPGSGWSLPSWSFTVAPKDQSVKPYTVWMIDSSDTRMARDNNRYDAPSASGRDKLWVTHYPVVKDEYYSAGGSRHIGDRHNMEGIGNGLHKGCFGSASCWPNIVLSGHQHLYQHLALEFGGEVKTDAYVAGHGGVRMDFDALPGFAGNETGLRDCKSSFSKSSDRHQVMGQDNMTAQTQTARAYGFLTMTRNAASAGPNGPQSGWAVAPAWYVSPAPKSQSAASCDRN